MRVSLDPFYFLVTAIAGWISHHQQEVIAYLMEENRVLREQIGNERLRFTDDQRRRLAAKAKKLWRKTLDQVATIAAPETLLRWHGKLIAQNDAPSACRTRGLQLITKSLLWSSAWLKRIAAGAIGGYRERWPIWATIWHTIQFGIF